MSEVLADAITRLAAKPTGAGMRRGTAVDGTSVAVGGGAVVVPAAWTSPPAAGQGVLLLSTPDGSLVGLPLGAGPAVPAGSLVPYAGPSAPAGWLLCDGAAVGRAAYPALFAAVGTSYGPGDGATTFNLPDMRGRVPVGRDPAQPEFDVLGEKGGAKTHTLTEAQMPSHSHAPPVTVTYNGNAGSYRSLFATNSAFWISGDWNNLVTYTGGNQPHNNLQPYLVVNHIIKT